MRLKIRHVTRYQFETPVNFALQQIRKTPSHTAYQSVQGWSTTLSGGTKELSFLDQHGNLTELVSTQTGTQSFEVISEGEVAITDTNGIVGRHSGAAPLWMYLKATEQTKAGTGVKSILDRIDTSGSCLENLHGLSTMILSDVAYEIGASNSHWSAEDALKAGKGVCQDHTHVFLACARAMNIPARYVSGYLMLDNTTTQDAMHAWAEAHVPDLGWVGFDVSNGISPDARYVRVATGLDYSEAAPISGARIGGAAEMLDVQIEVAQQ